MKTLLTAELSSLSGGSSIGSLAKAGGGSRGRGYSRPKAKKAQRSHTAPTPVKAQPAPQSQRDVTGSIINGAAEEIGVMGVDTLIATVSTLPTDYVENYNDDDYEMFEVCP